MIISQTDGLVTGYQRTNVTTSGAQVVESTGGYIYIGVMELPSYEPLVLEEAEIEERDKFGKEEDILETGYKELSLENRLFAEELFPVDLKDWPNWATD